MARTGRPPIPLEVKRRRGTLRPGRLANRGASLVPLEPISAEVLDLPLREAAERALEAATWLHDDASAAPVMLLAEAIR